MGLLAGCVRVEVKTHHGWTGPDTYEATDGKVSVTYYNGLCCCVAKQVLESLAGKANAGKLDWSMMANDSFKNRTLSEECKVIKARE